MQAWHVAQTHPYAGLLAETELKRQGYEAFNPTIKETVDFGRGRTREVERPYVPGYIFIRFDRELDEWRPIQWTRGIKALMYSTVNVPARISDAAMGLLLDRCVVSPEGKHYVDERAADALLWSASVGDTVKIKDGSFGGFVGPITWAEGHRLKVLLSIFGRQTEASLLKKQVEPITCA